MKPLFVPVVEMSASELKNKYPKEPQMAMKPKPMPKPAPGKPKGAKKSGC